MPNGEFLDSVNQLSAPDLQLCCLATNEGSDSAHLVKELLTEIRNSNIPAKYWNYLREYPKPPFPTLVHGIAIWFTASATAAEICKVLRQWLNDNPCVRVEITLNKPTTKQVDITEMTEEQCVHAIC